MAGYRTYKRAPELKWWQEAGEKPISKNPRITEGYESNRLQPGTDGRNPPRVTDEYAKGSGSVADKGRKYDDLGASAPHATKPKKGGEPDVKVKEKIRAEIKRKLNIKEDEEFPEEDFDPEYGEDDGMMGQEDPMGGDEGFEDFGDEGKEAGIGDEVTDEVVNNMIITIGDQEFQVTPVESAEDGLEGEGFEDEGFEDGIEGETSNDMLPDEEFEAEDKDITHESKRTGKKVIKESKDAYDRLLDQYVREAKQETKASLVKKYIELRKKAAKAYQGSTKALNELFTGSYVINKQGEVGFDFSDVVGDESFAVVSAAHDGKQYTPTVPNEPVYDTDKLTSAPSKAPKTQKAKVPEAKKTAFQNWIREQEKKYLEGSEEDPGVASERFNKTDTEDNFIGDDLANMPEVLGAEKDRLTTYNSVAEQRRKRKQGFETKRPMTESAEPFDFKKHFQK